MQRCLSASSEVRSSAVSCVGRRGSAAQAQRAELQRVQRRADCRADTRVGRWPSALCRLGPTPCRRQGRCGAGGVAQAQRAQLQRIQGRVVPGDARVNLLEAFLLRSVKGMP